MRDRIAAFWASLSASVIAEVMNPGATQLTVIPRLASSCATALVIPSNPAFDAT